VNDTDRLNPIGNLVKRDVDSEAIQIVFTIYAKPKTCGSCPQRDLRFNFCRLFKAQLFVERQMAMRCLPCKLAERDLMRRRAE
jgi:hypothetical protein